MDRGDYVGIHSPGPPSGSMVDVELPTVTFEQRFGRLCAAQAPPRHPTPPPTRPLGRAAAPRRPRPAQLAPRVLPVPPRGPPTPPQGRWVW
jgi:hypothetical protein